MTKEKILEKLIDDIYKEKEQPQIKQKVNLFYIESINHREISIDFSNDENE